MQTFGASAISQVLDAFKDLGFRFATQAGITISKNDVVVPPSKPEILAKYEERVDNLQEQYEDGLITQEERHLAVTDQWNAATDEVADAMIANIEKTDQLNSIYMMASSGARGSFKQIRQLAGMRGLMANPKGEIIERPVKANFMEGLDVIEYFTSTHGARKGLADTALRTADSGYLTRRLVDVAQDVIIRIEDCGTEEFLEIAAVQDHGRAGGHARRARRGRRHQGRQGTSIVAKGEEIGREALAALVAANQDATAGANGAGVKIAVRSTLKCEATVGVCQKCYGRAMATGKTAMIGDAVGIVAAQSIGEPGTQLTMRTFHTGGVAGADITHGLPRVVELFEARKPKGLAKIAEVSGAVSIEDTDKARTVVITDEAGEEHRYTFPRRTRLHVAEGEVIEAGKQLNEGSLYPHELLDLRGRTDTEVVPRQGSPGGLQVPGRGHPRQAHRADRASDAQEDPRRAEGRHGPAAGPVRRPPRVPADQREGDGRGRRAGGARRDHPRHHQGLAGHGLLPLGGLLPGDHEGPHRRGARGQDRPPRGPEGERDHRQADPGGHGPQALPRRSRSSRRSRCPAASTTSACSRATTSPPSSASATTRACRASARPSTRPSWTRSTRASARRAARSTTSAPTSAAATTTNAAKSRL